MNENSEPSNRVPASGLAVDACSESAWLRVMVGVMDKGKIQCRANLSAYGGKFYSIGNAQWCDTATESYKRVGPDLWERYE